jgi:acetyl esterase/lipase
MIKIRCLFLLLLFFQARPGAIAQTVMPLYPGPIPNSKPSPDREWSETDKGILLIRKVSRPTLTVYAPADGTASGTAVIICPGGGYSLLAAAHEGADVAKKFAEMGVTAFVLKYRIPDDSTMLSRETGPLQDAQQAIRMVRMEADRWKIRPDRIGILGFSAGGHLASTAGTHFNQVTIPDPEHTSLRPDFMILIYPVISFRDSIGHLGSRENLIGKNPSPAKIDAYSNEEQVTAQTPPAFLIHAGDDDVVKPANSILFYEALLRNHVPAELHLFQEGGHGFGLALRAEKESWIDLGRHWMALNHFIP